MNCSSNDHVCWDCDEDDDSEECDDPEEAAWCTVVGGCCVVVYCGAGGRNAAPGCGNGNGRGSENVGCGTIGDDPLGNGGMGEGFISLCTASSCSSLWNI